jgi:hypothetical protein
MHPLAYRIFSFLIFVAISASFIAVGMLIIFSPATYMRWVRWSNAQRHSRWVLRGWDLNKDEYSWQFKVPGVLCAFFGVVAIVLSVWIFWLQ